MKTLLYTTALLGCLSLAQGAELTAWATWSDFDAASGATSLTSDDNGAVSLTISDTVASFTDAGELSITGSTNGGAAYVDISGGALTMTKGFTVAFSIKNIDRIPGTGGDLAAILGVKGDTVSNGHLLAVGYNTKTGLTNNPCFAYNGGVGNASIADGTMVSGAFAPYVSPNTTSALVAIVVTSSATSMYIDGNLVATCTYTENTTDTVTRIALGGWASTSTNGSTTATYENLVIYDQALTKSQVIDYVPEPATATLSLLALAGLCARRRRK